MAKELYGMEGAICQIFTALETKEHELQISMSTFYEIKTFS
jgi:hypothetical protein